MRIKDKGKQEQKNEKQKIKQRKGIRQITIQKRTQKGKKKT